MLVSLFQVDIRVTDSLAWITINKLKYANMNSELLKCLRYKSCRINTSRVSDKTLIELFHVEILWKFRIIQ